MYKHVGEIQLKSNCLLGYSRRLKSCKAFNTNTANKASQNRASDGTMFFKLSNEKKNDNKQQRDHDMHTSFFNVLFSGENFQ